MREKWRCLVPQVSQSFRSKNDCQEQLIILTLQVEKPRLLEIKWHAWKHSVAQGTGSDQVSMLTTLSPAYSYSNMQSPCFGGFHTSKAWSRLCSLWAKWLYTWEWANADSRDPFVLQRNWLWPSARRQFSKWGGFLTNLYCIKWNI